MGKALIVIGGVFLVFGLVWQYAPWLLNWFGKLPGDIRIESERFTLFVPITTMVVVSLVLTLIVRLLGR